MAQTVLRDGRLVAVDPATDAADFGGLPASSPGASMLAGPRWSAAHPVIPAPTEPVIPMPVPPGTMGRLVRLPGGRLGVTPQNLAPLGAPPAAPPVNFDPPPGTNVIQGMPNGVLVVTPLPPGFAGDDAGQINTAILQCASNRVLADGTTVQGGRVELAVGIFSIKSAVACPYVAPITVRGQGPQATVLQFSGTGDAVSFMNAYVPAGGPNSIVVWGGGVQDMTIDMSLATVVSGAFTATNTSATFNVTGAALANGTPVCLTGGSVPTPFAYAQPYWVVNAGPGTVQLSATQGGAPITATSNGSGTITVVNSALHAGDVKLGSFTRLHLANANSAGGIGLWQDNRFYWTEDSDFDVHCLQCYNGAVIDCSGSSAASTHDNNDYRIALAGLAGGNGVVFQNGANAYNSRWYIHGGIRSIASVTVQNYFLVLSNVGGAGFLNNAELIMKVESDGGLASTPGLIWTQGGSSITANGSLAFQTGHGTPSSISGQFKFTGPIWGDTSLQGLTPPAITLGTPATLLKPPQLMVVTPGTGSVTAIKINGVTTGATSGSFYLTPGTVYEVDGTAGASVVFVPIVSQ